jgi:AAA ATPase domain
MIEIPITIELRQLWAGKTFSKTKWGEINVIVGSNGTGKSLFADQLKLQLHSNGYVPRLLNAERLSGFEKQNYNYFGNSNLNQGLNISQFNDLKIQGEAYGLSSSALIILKERLDIRVRIEALLSDIFGKTIRLIEVGGFLKPAIQNKSLGEEYDLKEKECHGLKELITLLTFIYDDSKNCLILDEPELHLHPQFQSFLLSEIRKNAGNPVTDSTKKIFFIITHSPYFLDFRKIDDLKNVLVCQHNVPPSFIDLVEEQDEYILKRFLPRFNTHHKQFFFSPNPVFVEGYTDQQIISLLLDKLDYNISASGSSIIDVGGKSELAVFFKLCKNLGIKARVIADLDAFFIGKLREVAEADESCNSFVQDNGLGTNLSTLIGELSSKIKSIADSIVKSVTTDPDIIDIIKILDPIVSVGDKRNTVITSSLMCILKFKEKIINTLPSSSKSSVEYVSSRFYLLLKALEAGNIFILPDGEIENYFTQTELDYLNITDNEKKKSFHTERDYILSCEDPNELEKQYQNLISILKESVPQMKVDLNRHMKFQIMEWIQVLQTAIAKGDVNGLDELQSNAKVDYKSIKQIINVINLNVEDNKTFVCKIKINDTLLITSSEISFNERTVAHNFEF